MLEVAAGAASPVAIASKVVLEVAPRQRMLKVFVDEPVYTCKDPEEFMNVCSVAVALPRVILLLTRVFEVDLGDVILGCYRPIPVSKVTLTNFF